MLLLSLIGAGAAHAAPDPLSWDGAYPLSLAAQQSTVGCASSTQCTAVDIGGGEVTYNPFVIPASPPTRHDVDPSDSNVLGIACPSTTQCTLVDGGGGVLTFNPQSAAPSGTRSVLNASIAAPAAIACPSATQCTAVIADSEVTFNPQVSPATGTPHTIDNTSVVDVSCPSVSQCTALDSEGREITFDPTSSTPSSDHYAVVLTGAQAINCPSSAQCVAVDSAGNEATFTPTAPPTITQSHDIGAGRGLFDVECPSTTQCTAINDMGAAVTFDPTSATPNSAATGVSTSPLTGISCPSTSVCAVVDNNFDGHTGRNPAAYASPTLSLTAAASGTEGTAIPTSGVSAVLGGAFSPSGPLTIRVYGPSATAPTSCVGGQAVGTLSVTGNGTYHPTSAFTPLTGVGNYWWYATYGGDPANNPVHSTCGAGMARTVVRPGLSLSAPREVSPGTAIQTSQLSATLSNGSSPTGTITFKVFGPQSAAPISCAGGTTVGTATVSGNGTYHPSSGFTSAAVAGRYWWYTSYGGDGNNPSADTACGPTMTEMDVDPSLSVSVPAAGTAGTAISASSMSAVLADGVTPTGTITFRVFGPADDAPTTCSGGTVVGTATVTGNGTYHASGDFTPVTGAGNYWWTATYGGDTSNPSVSSTCGLGMSKTTVAAVQPSLSLSAPAAGTLGTQIPGTSLTAVLSGGFAPVGPIFFWAYGPAATAPTSCDNWQLVGTANVSGNGTYHPNGDFSPDGSFTPARGAGHYWWYAVYAGDSSNGWAASTCGAGMTMTTVAALPTAVAVSAPATGTPGSAIAISDVTAALSGGSSPSGTITLKVFGPQSAAPADCSTGGTVLASSTVHDNGAFHPLAAFTPSTAGSYWWYAGYSGDSADAGSASACGASMTHTTVSTAEPAPAPGAGAGPAGGSGGSGGPPPPSGGLPGISGDALPAATVAAATVAGTTVSVPVSCTGQSACALKLKLTVIETLRKGKLVALSAKTRTARKTVTIASASGTVAAGAKKTIKLKLNAIGKKLLATHSPLKARLTVTLGGTTVSTKKVTLKRPAKKKSAGT